MGQIEKGTQLMRTFYLSLCVLLAGGTGSCNAQSPQQNTYHHMKKFDIAAYERKIMDDPSVIEFKNEQGTLVQQYHHIQEGYVEENFDKTIVAEYVEEHTDKEGGYRTVYVFDAQGDLKEVRYFFGPDMEIGQWKRYVGGREELTDKDKDYESSVAQILEIGNRHQVNLRRNGHLKRLFSDEYKTHIWVLEWNTGQEGLQEGTYVFRKMIVRDSDRKILLNEENTIVPIEEN